MKTKVLICENCKRIYVSDLYGKLNFHCECSHKILSETHESNRINAENYLNNSKKKINVRYKRNI